MTPEQIEAQRPLFEAWWATSGRDPAWCSRRDNGSYSIRMVEIAFDAWLAAKADQVEVTEEMVERGARALAPIAWAALGSGDTIAQQNRRTASLRHARTALNAALNPASPQGTEAAT